MKQTALLFFFGCFFGSAQAQIAGRIVDENNDPLPFVSVYIRNSGNGTAANAAGEFRLTAKPGKYELVFQYIGYKQKIEPIQLGDKPLRLVIRMEPDELLLAQVEITAEDPAIRIMREVIGAKYWKFDVVLRTAIR